MVSVIDMLETLGLFTFEPVAVETIDAEVALLGPEHAEVYRDLLLLASAEIEAVWTFLGNETVPMLPLETPLPVSRAAASIAATSAKCEAFICGSLREYPETLEPWHFAVFSGDVAKLELARNRLGIESWAGAGVEEIARVVQWISDEWKDKGESLRAPKVDVVRLQGVLWVAAVERLLRPDRLEERTSNMAAALDVARSPATAQ